jgi:hypothetical protein
LDPFGISVSVQRAAEPDKRDTKPEIVVPRPKSSGLFLEDRDRGPEPFRLADAEGHLNEEVDPSRIVVCGQLQRARVITSGTRHIQGARAVTCQLEETARAGLECMCYI